MSQQEHSLQFASLTRIEKPDGKETYQVLTNATGARILLKEEFPNGAITELLRSKE